VRKRLMVETRLGTVSLPLRLHSGMLEVNTVKERTWRLYTGEMMDGECLMNGRPVCTHRSFLCFLASVAELGEPWPSINSKSLVTVRQFLPVLVVRSFESKY
jgi:hypothetical protein